MVKERSVPGEGFEHPSGEYLEIKEIGVKIPIFDLRNLDDHEAIASSIAIGARVAFFGGVWGVFKGVEHTKKEELFFHIIKTGRPKEAKIAMLTQPKVAVDMIDWSKVHPQFRNLQDPQEFDRLWSSHGSFLHIIGPVSPELYDLPGVFITTPEDFKARYPNLKPIKHSTACFVWHDDPYLENVVKRTEELSPKKIHIGVSTLNTHGQEPPYAYEELIGYLSDGRIDPRAIDLVVRDKIYEDYEAFGSHTQIRVPLDSEEPVLKVVRIGSLSPDGFRNSTGYDLEVIPDAKDVRRFPGEDIDNVLFSMHNKIKQSWLQVKKDEV